VEPRTLVGLARYFGRLGASGFGGPIVYARYQGLTVVQDVFFGVGPTVLGAIWYGGGLAWPRSAIGLTPLPFATIVRGLSWTGTGNLASMGLFFAKRTLGGPPSITIGICALALLLQPRRHAARMASHLLERSLSSPITRCRRRVLNWTPVIGVALLSFAGTAISASSSLPLRTIADVPLGGRSPRFDYQTIDPPARRLYIAHQGDGTILTIDLATRRIIGRIGGLPNVHGVLVVPALHRLFATATALHELVTIDTRTDHVLARTPAGVVPDGIAYDPVGRHAFVSDERPAGALIVADATTGQATGTIPLGGAAGNVQYDPVARRVLVGVETRDELALIDPKTLQITRRVPLPGCDANHSLLVDPHARLLIIGCSANGRLLVLDADSFRVLGSIAGAGHIDVLALDPAHQRVYAASEDGIVSVIQVAHGTAPRLLGQAHLAARAHSVAVDPRTSLVYLPLGTSGGASVLRIMRPTRP
jgi:DNA-binding beta-propeller fold protein YncE